MSSVPYMTPELAAMMLEDCLKVSDLINLLLQYPPDTPVLMTNEYKELLQPCEIVMTETEFEADSPSETMGVATNSFIVLCPMDVDLLDLG